MARVALGLLLLCTSLTGCGAGKPAESPDQVLHAYATALKSGDAKGAYALLSEEAQRSLPFEAFKRMLEENPQEVQQIAVALSRDAEPQEITATITASDGETLELVYENGAWKASASAVDLYSQATPKQALSAFIRAFEAHRYDILMRFVPKAEVGKLNAEKLKAAWEGEQKTEMETKVAALKNGLPTAKVEILARRATVAYGPDGAASVLLVEEDGVWKIEDFDDPAYSSGSPGN